MEGVYMPKINVFYPNKYSDGLFCHYYSYYIEINKDDYFNSDVITHEYGHYICKYFDFCDTDVGGRHFIGEDLIKSRGYKNGCKIALSEGLASLIGFLSQFYYKDLYCFPYFGDEKYQIFDNNNKVYSYDFSKYCYGESPSVCGEGNEFSIISVLIKLIDDVYRDDDFVSIGYIGFFDVLNLRKHSSISSLISDIIEKNSDLTNYISLILGLEAFSPIIETNKTYLVTDENNNCWTIKWD